MRALLIALLLAGGTTKPGANKLLNQPKPAEPAAAPAPAPRPPPSGPDRRAFLSIEGLDGEVLGFLFLPVGAPLADGSGKEAWEGAGSAQLRLSHDGLDRRTEQVTIAAVAADDLMKVVQRFYESGGAEPAGARARLLDLSGAPLDDARAAWLQASKIEERRLFFIQKALDAAAEAGEPLPGVSVELIERRAAALRDGRLAKAVEVRVAGYKALAAGLVAHLDGDSLAALEKMKVAAQGLPDVPVVHVYLGSLYYLFQQNGPATAAWKKALELDPTNETVKAALKEYGRKGR